jgi:LysM repeat protein
LPESGEGHSWGATRGGIIDAMTDRGLPIVDGAPACPFVAFEDDRDERATSPDHRHRCYAEVRPAPRALAHQEAYCLSSAFPVCPTFQDWARREAAREREARVPPPVPADDDEPHRNPPRDWSAPPPWTADPGLTTTAGGAGGMAAATGAAGAEGQPRPGAGAADTDGEPEPPSFLASRAREGQGLAGSPADRLAGRGSEPAGASPVADHGPPAGHDVEPSEGDERERPGRSDRFDHGPGPDQVRPREPVDLHGPTWERPRRYEAYPTIRTRFGMPSLPPIAMMVAAIVIAAIALFYLPALLGFGEPDRGVGTATPSPATSVAPSGSIEPSATPGPTQQTYIVMSGDTMSSIARRFGVTLDDLIAANLATVPDPDKLDVGDELIIPSPSAAPASADVSPSAEALPSP